MRPGFWQAVLVVALVVLFFHRPLVAIARRLLGLTRAPRRPDAQGPVSFRGPAVCTKCGADLPSGARFCPRCGADQSFIDV